MLRWLVLCALVLASVSASVEEVDRDEAAEDIFATKRVHLPVSKFKILYNRLASEVAARSHGLPDMDVAVKDSHGGKRSNDADLDFLRSLVGLRHALSPLRRSESEQ